MLCLAVITYKTQTQKEIIMIIIIIRIIRIIIIIIITLSDDS